jgi:hypothetical protein
MHRTSTTWRTFRYSMVAAILLADAGMAGAAPQASVPAPSPGTLTLTNQSVVDMVKGGLPPEVILMSIRNSNANFDLSPSGLVVLHQNSVPDTLIQAMQAKSGMAQAPASPGDQVASPGASSLAPNPDDPASPHEQGIYAMVSANGAKQMMALDPTVFSDTKDSGRVGGMLMAMATEGFAGGGSKTKGVIRGAHSANRITDPGVVFYFYLDAKASAFGGGGTMSAPSTPAMFDLIKLDEKEDSREVVVSRQSGGMGGGRMHSGPSKKDQVPFDFEKIKPGVYKVTLKSPLPDGEYAFQTTGSSAMAMMPGGGGSHIFDFSMRTH